MGADCGLSIMVTFVFSFAQHEHLQYCPLCPDLLQKLYEPRFDNFLIDFVPLPLWVPSCLYRSHLQSHPIVAKHPVFHQYILCGTTEHIPTLGSVPTTPTPWFDQEQDTKHGKQMLAGVERRVSRQGTSNRLPRCCGSVIEFKWRQTSQMNTACA